MVQVRRTPLLLAIHAVYQKDFYMRLTDAERPAYLAPRKRYTYWTPKALKRGKHTHTGERRRALVRRKWHVWASALMTVILSHAGFGGGVQAPWASARLPLSVSGTWV